MDAKQFDMFVRACTRWDMRRYALRLFGASALGAVFGSTVAEHARGEQSCQEKCRGKNARQKKKCMRSCRGDRGNGGGGGSRCFGLRRPCQGGIEFECCNEGFFFHTACRDNGCDGRVCCRLEGMVCNGACDCCGTAVCISDRCSGGDGGTPTCSSDEYRAQYWDNTDMSGSPALVRCESWPIDHRWGEGGPGGGVPTEQFSARWTGRAGFAAGEYLFRAFADDQIRVLIDGEEIVPFGPSGQVSPEARVRRFVSGGMHDIVVEYREYYVSAAVFFRYDWVGGGTCSELRQACTSDNQCCGDAVCQPGCSAEPRCCMEAGGPCEPPSSWCDCCGNLECYNGTCIDF